MVLENSSEFRDTNTHIRSGSRQADNLRGSRLLKQSKFDNRPVFSPTRAIARLSPTNFRTGKWSRVKEAGGTGLKLDFEGRDLGMNRKEMVPLFESYQVLPGSVVHNQRLEHSYGNCK